MTTASTTYYDIRAKESLLVDFINQTDLDQIGDKVSVIKAFFAFAHAEPFKSSMPHQEAGTV